MFLDPHISQYDNLENFKYTDTEKKSYCEKTFDVKYIIFKKSKQRPNKIKKKYNYVKYYKRNSKKIK